MPKSHKRWTSYELMLKRVKKPAYRIAECWKYNPFYNWWVLTTTLCHDHRDPVTIAAYREIRATNRAWLTIAAYREIRAMNRAKQAEIREMVLALAMVFHARLGENGLWHDLPEAVMRMIVCEAYIPFN